MPQDCHTGLCCYAFFLLFNICGNVFTIWYYSLVFLWKKILHNSSYLTNSIRSNQDEFLLGFFVLIVSIFQGSKGYSKAYKWRFVCCWFRKHLAIACWTCPLCRRVPLETWSSRYLSSTQTSGPDGRLRCREQRRRPTTAWRWREWRTSLGRSTTSNRTLSVWNSPWVPRKILPGPAMTCTWASRTIRMVRWRVCHSCRKTLLTATSFNNILHITASIPHQRFQLHRNFWVEKKNVTACHLQILPQAPNLEIARSNSASQATQAAMS